MTIEDKKPWYRQVWFWFVMTPLIVVVCVSAVLVTIAYYKQGRMINQTLEQDRMALAYGLSAHLRFDQVTGEVLATLPAHEAVPEKLLLLLDHPFEADLDQQIVLHQLAAGRYRGDLEGALDFSWYLVLTPELDKLRRTEAEWILSGRIDFSRSDETELKPRISN
jgi:hypothetical protein